MGSRGAVDLVIGVGITRAHQVLAAHSHVNAEEFKEWLTEVSRAVPAHHKWFAKCWDQVLLQVLAHGDLCFILAIHECAKRHVAKAMLTKLRDEVGPTLPNPQLSRVSQKLKALACSIKGVVPPRKVLVLYEGAPKKFLTKEEQAPEYLDSAVGRTRLQKALEDAETEEDAFVFNVNDKKKSTVEEDEAEDAFTFNFPPKQNSGVQKPGLIYTIQVSAGPVKTPQKPLSKKFSASPGKSGDFLWNGVRVSPDVSGMGAQGDPNAQGGAFPRRPLAKAFHSTLHALSGRSRGLFSAQFDRDGKSRAGGAGKGAVGSIAPSGLSWEDEIASQLAAAGVRVCSADTGADEKGSPSDGNAGKSASSAEQQQQAQQQQTAASRRFSLRPPLIARTQTHQGPAPPHLTEQFRQGSFNVSKQAEAVEARRGLGLGRLARGLRRTFRHASAEDGSS